jgi:hypothetical protein
MPPPYALSPAVADLVLVRSMRLSRVVPAAALFALASCATVGPAGYALEGRVRDISPREIDRAIQAVQHHCIKQRRAFLPVYRIDVVSSDGLEVDCGPHYGRAPAAGALLFHVGRIRGEWQVMDMQEYIPNPERVIVT